MSIAKQLVSETLKLKWEDLDQKVLHQTKRVVMDALGCCFGAIDANAVGIVRDYIAGQHCSGDSTIIGSEGTHDTLNALLLNGMMLRYLDFNDLHSVAAGKRYVGSHPSESIPAILSVGEKIGASGRDIIIAIVIAYQLSANFCKAAKNPPLSKLGWNIDTRGLYIVPLVIGRLLGLDQEKIENALGISGCQGMVLGILDTAAEEYTMAKSLRYPRTVYNAVQSTFLAQLGFTGPKTVIEGVEGFNSTVMGNQLDLDELTQGFRHFHILDTGFKDICAVGAIQGHLQATLNLVRRYNILPEQIDNIKIIAGTRPIEHTGDPAKKFPVNKETADHSSYYLTAIAVIDRDIGPEQYQQWKYKDPQVISLINRILLEIDPNMDEKPRSGMSIIQTKDGQYYENRVDYPLGHPLNPLNDADLERKFKKLSAKHLSEKQIHDILDRIYHLEQLSTIGELMKLMRIT